VSEVGFIMEATLHLMVEQLRELKNAVNAGQEELKTDINHVKTELKTNIGAVTAGQEELKNDMKSEINAVKKQHQRCEG
jgi:gas vesicle protein